MSKKEKRVKATYSKPVLKKQGNRKDVSGNIVTFK